MELTNPAASGLMIANIEGLGPANANIITNELATVDGSVFSSARQTNRNIVMTIVMWPGEDIETMRQKTYRYFPIKKDVVLRIETDNKLVECTGYVESNTPVIFTEQEYTQVSIICPDPYFYDLNNTVVSFDSIIPLFEFPFSNESVTENLIEFGEIYLDTRRTIEYAGDEDVGLTINITVMDASVKNITISNTQTYEKFIIYTDKIKSITGKQLQAGDEIYVVTNKGSKSVRLLRDGRWTNIISAIDKDSDWFQLSVGPNEFDYTVEQGVEYVSLGFSYRNAYGGV